MSTSKGRSYLNAEAFRQSLETRLRTLATERRVQIQGLRLKIAIERLLAKLFAEPDPPWLLKGTMRWNFDSGRRRGPHGISI